MSVLKNTDFDLLREQRDILVELIHDEDGDDLSQDQVDAINGIVNFLDALLDEHDGI